MATGWKQILETGISPKGCGPSLHNIPLDLICWVQQASISLQLLGVSPRSKAEDQVPKRRCLSSSETPGPREEEGKASQEDCPHAKVKGRFSLLHDPGQEEEAEGKEKRVTASVIRVACIQRAPAV